MTPLTFGRFLMRVGMLGILLGGGLCLASLLGYFDSGLRWGLYVGIGSVLCLCLGTSIFARKSSGVRLPPGEKEDR